MTNTKIYNRENVTALLYKTVGDYIYKRIEPNKQHAYFLILYTKSWVHDNIDSTHDIWFTIPHTY